MLNVNTNKMMSKKLTFEVIVSSRKFFNTESSVTARSTIEKKLSDLGYGIVIADRKAADSGAVSGLADAKIYAELFKEHRDAIDGIIVVLPNFGDEVAVVETIRRSSLDIPILVQACNDDLVHLDVHGIRDSYCGKFRYATICISTNIPWTDTTEHTTDIEGETFSHDLDRFGRICRVVNGLRQITNGITGGRPKENEILK